MAINADKTRRWKQDIAESVDYYNRWFLAYAPRTFRYTRIQTTEQVIVALKQSNNLLNVAPDLLIANPNVLNILRMATAPPIARDRLIGLADVKPRLVNAMEKDNKIPPRMEAAEILSQLKRVTDVITKLLDYDIFSWLADGSTPSISTVERAATIVADRLTGAIANPLIRNEQEKRQLQKVANWLQAQGYRNVTDSKDLSFKSMIPGTFAFRLNIPVQQPGSARTINLPVDIVIKPINSLIEHLPILVEAKSAGDFTNTNKRRKEEATKVNQLRYTYGDSTTFLLFLCGYFDSGYLGYEAAEHIDWVWEHRIDDFKKIGI